MKSWLRKNFNEKITEQIMQKNGELIGGKSRIRSRKREKKSGKKEKKNQKKRVRTNGKNNW